MIEISGNEQVFYIDGIEVGSSSLTDPLPWTHGSDTYIGKHGDGGDAWDIDGVIDEIAVWNRTLSYHDIQDLSGSNALLSCGQACIHRADKPPCDGHITMPELTAFISLWKYDSTAYKMREMMEAVTLFYNP